MRWESLWLRLSMWQASMMIVYMSGVMVGICRCSIEITKIYQTKCQKLKLPFMRKSTLHLLHKIHNNIQSPNCLSHSTIKWLWIVSCNSLSYIFLKAPPSHRPHPINLTSCLPSPFMNLISHTHLQSWCTYRTQ